MSGFEKPKLPGSTDPGTPKRTPAQDRDFKETVAHYIQGRRAEDPEDHVVYIDPEDRTQPKITEPWRVAYAPEMEARQEARRRRAEDPAHDGSEAMKRNHEEMVRIVTEIEARTKKGPGETA